jgi:ribosomal protein L3
MLVRGAVPGHRDGRVIVTPTVKNRKTAATG